MKKNIFKSLALFSLLSLMVSCGENKDNTGVNGQDSAKTGDTAKVVANTEAPANYDPRFDIISSLIAGIKPNGDTKPYGSADTLKSWKDFAQNFDASMKDLDTRRHASMKEWAKTELKEANASDKPLFYPFSGPDFINAYTLFPNASSYILVAGELPGELPDLAKMNNNQKQQYFNSVQVSLNDLFRKSYFITSHMGRDLYRVSGTVPIMCIFLKRTGCTITDIKKVALDSAGNFFEYTKLASTQDVAYGAKISFMAPGSNKIRTLYYLSTNLVDARIKANKGFSAYLKKLGRVNTYLKAASYCMHDHVQFNLIRDAVLDNSDCVLQDDSGIAYRDFLAKKVFDIQLYGEYAKPTKDFPWIREPELEKAYKDSSLVKPLPFEGGYRVDSKKYNQLKATIKK